MIKKMTKPITIEKKKEIMIYLKEHTWKETSNYFNVSEMTINRIQNELTNNTLTNTNDEITLTDKLVLLMVKAGVNSDFYNVDIKESEIESSIQKLQNRGLI